MQREASYVATGDLSTEIGDLLELGFAPEDIVQIWHTAGLESRAVVAELEARTQLYRIEYSYCDAAERARVDWIPQLRRATLRQPRPGQLVK